MTSRFILKIMGSVKRLFVAWQDATALHVAAAKGYIKVMRYVD